MLLGRLAPTLPSHWEVAPEPACPSTEPSQALALIQGRDFVLPDDVKRLSVPVLGHRLILSTEAYLHNTSKEELIADILSTLPVPAEEQSTG